MKTDIDVTEGVPDIDLCRKYLRLVTSAKDRQIEFNLSLCAYKNLLKRKVCPYSGRTLIHYGPKCNTSIDRIDNTKGYIAGNVIACDTTDNGQKSDMSTEMIYAMAKICKQYTKKKGKTK